MRDSGITFGVDYEEYLMLNQLSIGFIGLGEAGFEIARGLKSEGCSRIFAYDKVKTDLVKKRFREADVERKETTRDVVEQSDIILSVVPSKASVAVADELCAHLEDGKIYIDLTSSFPDDMKTIASMVDPCGVNFVDGAMMGALPVHGHKVLIYVSGPQAEAAVGLLNQAGMNLKVIGREVGQASAVKLILSIATKGFGSLLTEMLLASHHFNVDEPVLEALEQFYAKGLPAYIDRSVGSSAIYAGRRVIEMEASVRLLKSIGVEPVMTEATVKRLKWFESLGLSRFFGGIAPDGYRDVIMAWEKMGLFAHGKRPR
jgi:3-hydroxyisobutyrate dehydrogenase-like beta-hydroxyacid dehydrogenase